MERKPGVLRNGAPFAEMPEPLVRLQRLLLRREGGDRVMSQMLAVVPKAGLDTVLVAVELVLESGVVSVEHVLNVIARLNQAPLPESVPTTLQVKEAPVADTGRYDRLRTRRLIMRELGAELKALRLYGMASTWAELSANGGDVGLQSALAHRAPVGGRIHRPHHALGPLPDVGRPLPRSSGSGGFRLRAVVR